MFWARTQHGQSLDQDSEELEHILQLLVPGRGLGPETADSASSCSTGPCHSDSWALLPGAPGLGSKDCSLPLQPHSSGAGAVILLEGVAQGLGENSAVVRVAFPSDSRVQGRSQGF